MSRSYRVLAAALAGMLGLAALAWLADGRGTPDDAAAAAPAGTVTPTAAPSTTPAGNAGPHDDGSIPVDVVDGDVAPPSTTVPAPAGDCTIVEAVEAGSSGDGVRCLQSRLASAGYPAAATGSWDAATEGAVRAYQAANALQVDGVVGRVTAQSLGIWAGPTGPPPATDADCPDSDHAAIIDRANQRGALCDSGAIVKEFPITSAWSQPDPGTYDVYAKDMKTSSTFGGHYSTMTHFVAFTRGKYQGARIAFHSVPKFSNGEYVQPLDSVGTAERHGDSSGCIRVLPDDAVEIWDWLSIGDEVRVIS